MNKLEVHYCGWGEDWLLGVITKAQRGYQFAFSGPAIARGLELSPYKEPLRAELFSGFEASQLFLPGFIADALPDGWGMLLMDRLFQSAGIALSDVSPLDRLAFIGDRAMGALRFQPATDVPLDLGASHLLDLRTIAHEAQVIMSGHGEDVLREMALMGGSPHGARPKVVFYAPAGGAPISSAPSDGLTPWMAKFPGQGEPPDCCLVEYLYSKAARLAGVQVPATQHFELGNGLAAFACQRFDREDGMRVPTLSLAGALEVNFRLPCVGAESFIKLTSFMTRDAEETFRAYERVVLNVAFNNRDDHSKNFAYVMTRPGHWKLSPVYDLTYNRGPGGEHQMDVLGKGRNITKGDLLQLASNVGIATSRANACIEKITAASRTLIADIRNAGINRQYATEIIQAVDSNCANLSQIKESRPQRNARRPKL